MNIIKYKDGKSTKVGVTDDLKTVYELPYNNVLHFFNTAENKSLSPSAIAQEIINKNSPIKKPLHKLSLLVPIEISEVWAAGVTYQKSVSARNYESTQNKSIKSTFYDKVYNAERPELFLKSTGKRTIGQCDDIYLRGDSEWQIPEPELGLVLNNKSQVIGYTIGNDMSCRDIEGENPLYLPQAKIWKNSCSIGPTIRLAETVDNPYDFQIICRIYRGKEKVFEDSTTVNQLKRRLEELSYYLSKDNIVFNGTVLLTGTCVVPSNDFSLEDKDLIEIEIP